MLTGPQRLCVAKEKRLNPSVRSKGFINRSNRRNGPYLQQFLTSQASKLHIWYRNVIILLKCPYLEFGEIWDNSELKIIFSTVDLSK
jgi:hypothetical protein